MNNMPTNLKVFLLVLYLLFTMVVGFNITDSNKSSLRMTFN